MTCVQPHSISSFVSRAFRIIFLKINYHPCFLFLSCFENASVSLEYSSEILHFKLSRHQLSIIITKHTCAHERQKSVFFLYQIYAISVSRSDAPQSDGVTLNLLEFVWISEFITR